MPNEKRKALIFLQRWGRYNAGEIAGFDTDQTRKLTKGDRPVAEVYDPKKHGKPGAAAAKAQAKAAAQLDDLAAREADLAAREKALAEREKAVAAGDGKPPAQGGGQ